MAQEIQQQVEVTKCQVQALSDEKKELSRNEQLSNLLRLDELEEMSPDLVKESLIADFWAALAW